MSWLTRITQALGFHALRAQQPKQPLPEVLRAMAEGERFSIPESSVVENQAKLYQNLSWIQLAVTHTAQAAAAMDFDVKEIRGEDEAEDIPNHPFELLLRKPNPLQSRFEFLVATFSYFRLTGNAYWWLNSPSENEPPVEMWAIPSHMIKPIPDEKMFIKHFRYESKAGPPLELPVWSICHFKTFNALNPFIGLSPIESIMAVASGDIAMQKWNANYFGRENAKIPGALAFADPIPDSEWQQLKADIKDQWGGVSRSGPLMMRNAGKGGVEWLQMALSQREMEFLESRRFNKEEIFALFAPGLASVLDVNATEANALSGKATLMEYAVWPLLVSTAEKITNDVLPLYGENLIGEFEDPRQSNRLVDIQEQAAYERTHTIDEVRQEYYGDEPIGDERGQLLPAEIAKGSMPPQAEEETGPSQPQGQAMGDLMRWQRKCVNAIENGKAAGSVRFVSDFIDKEQYARIADGLRRVRTIDDVRRVFDAELSPSQIVPPRPDISRLIEGLDEAVRALRETT